MHMVHDYALTQVQQLHMGARAVCDRLVENLMLRDTLAQVLEHLVQVPTFKVGVESVHGPDVALDHFLVITLTFCDERCTRTDEHELYINGLKAPLHGRPPLLVAIVGVIHSHLPAMLEKALDLRLKSFRHLLMQLHRVVIPTLAKVVLW